MENRFSIGSVLGNGFRIWFKNLIPFLIITMLIYAPLLIWGITLVQGEPELFSHGQKLDTFAKASLAIVPLSNIFVAAALTYGVVMELQGSHASVGACIATGLVRFFPVLGVAILFVLVVGGSAFVIMLPAFAVGGGAFILVIPALIVAAILYSMLYVATPVAVLERAGIVGALKRSRELTNFKKMEIFGLWLILALMNWGVTKVVESTMLDPSSFTPENIYGVIRRYMYVDLARAIIVGSIGSVMTAVAYFQLRNEKEGTSADELAAVFE